MADDLVLAVLREIRDEIRATRTELGARIDATNERIDATNRQLDAANGRLDTTNGRLGHVETALLELAEQQSFVVRWLKADRKRGQRVEQELAHLRDRVEVIERRLGPDEG